MLHVCIRNTASVANLITYNDQTYITLNCI